MSDEPKRKPRTLEDLIESSSEADAPTRKSSRRKPTRAEAERLEALERAVRDTEPEAVRSRQKKSRDRSGKDLEDYYANKGWKAKKGKRRRKGGHGQFVFWAIAIMFIVAFVLD